MTHESEMFKAISAAPIVPVLVVDTVDSAIPLAQAFNRSGLPAIEVTLRTPLALEVISEMKSAAPQLYIGAGTVLNEGDLDAAQKCGADFVVTPGTTPDLLSAILERGTIAIPGISTASEALNLYEMGFQRQKFFPAEANGGAAYLKALCGPMPNISFMPTGGVTTTNLTRYLELPNVFAIGGTWIASPADIQNKRWTKIHDKSKDALEMAVAFTKLTKGAVSNHQAKSA